MLSANWWRLTQNSFFNQTYTQFAQEHVWHAVIAATNHLLVFVPRVHGCGVAQRATILFGSTRGGSRTAVSIISGYARNAMPGDWQWNALTVVGTYPLRCLPRSRPLRKDACVSVWCAVSVIKAAKRACVLVRTIGLRISCMSRINVNTRMRATLLDVRCTQVGFVTNVLRAQCVPVALRCPCIAEPTSAAQLKAA